MSEVDALAGKKFLLLGDTRLEITEPAPVPVLVVDFVTEIRVLPNGTVALSLGSAISDAGQSPEVRVCARLRLTMETLADIRGEVERQLAATEEARKAAN